MEATEFSTEQFRQIYPDGIENHYWNHARNAIILRFLKKCGLENHEILEIGGGRGVVTRYLHEKGIPCQGVELAPVEPVKGTKGYFFTGKNAFDMPESFRNKFTAVMLFDVIEHIENPLDFFDKILRSFPNAGNIVITVPARQELWTNYDDYNGHFRRYSMGDMKALTSAKIIYKQGGYFNHMLYPIFLLYANLIKQRETKLHAPAGIMIGVHRVLSWILQLDNILLPLSWRGTSCIALFKIIRT